MHLQAQIVRSGAQCLWRLHEVLSRGCRDQRFPSRRHGCLELTLRLPSRGFPRRGRFLALGASHELVRGTRAVTAASQRRDGLGGAPSVHSWQRCSCQPQITLNAPKTADSPSSVVHMQEALVDAGFFEGKAEAHAPSQPLFSAGDSLRGSPRTTATPHTCRVCVRPLPCEDSARNVAALAGPRLPR